MIKLMVGSNYDPALIDDLHALNEKYAANGVQCTEIYGSIQQIKIFGSARPDFRLPNISIDNFQQQVKAFNHYNIDVNYTENTPLLDKSKIDIAMLADTLEFLELVGVKRLTLAHPLAMDLVAKYSKLPVEVSTIYDVKNSYQLRELKSRCPNINKVCLGPNRNRDFDFLRRIKHEADGLGIVIELLANEFCVNDCVDRVQCYNDHAQISTEREASQFSRYPMGRCVNTRMDAVEWLRARFILPQWLDWYEKMLGISHFKVTGRTHPTPYITWVTEEYLKRDYHDNLLQLWADVRNIKRVSKGETEFLPPVDFIDTDLLSEDFLWCYWNDARLRENIDIEYAFLKTYL